MQRMLLRMLLLLALGFGFSIQPELLAAVKLWIAER